VSPWAPKKPCARPLCPKLVEGGTTYCEEHRKAYWRDKNARRPRELHRFYNSVAWKRLRDMKRRASPMCEMPGCTRPAEQVDHVQRLADRPDLGLVMENLRSLCFSHHSQRTMTDRARER
jgi:5-methylcytosine-specific restriction protein A